MSELADQSSMKLFDGRGPQRPLRVLPETRQQSLITQCVADVNEVSPEGHLGRSEQHGLFDCQRGSVEVADHYEISLKLMSSGRNSFNHARDIFLIDGPFEERARFSIEGDTAHQLEGASTKFSRLFFRGGARARSESAELSPVRTRVDQLIARPTIRFRQILSTDRLTRTRDVVKKCLLRNGGDLHRLGPQCVLNLVSRLGSIVVQCQVGDDRTDGIRCSLRRWLNLQRTKNVDTQFERLALGRWIRSVIGSWTSNFCQACRWSWTFCVRGRVEDGNVLHPTTRPSPNTPENESQEDKRDDRENLIERGSRRWIRIGGRLTFYDGCRQLFWKRDLECNGSSDVKRSGRFPNRTNELSSFGGCRTNRDLASPRVARDKEPVGGVKESAVRAGVWVVRLIHRIGFVSDVPMAGTTPEGDGRRSQGCHRGEEMAPIVLPVRELLRACIGTERQVNLTLGGEHVGSVETRSGEFCSLDEDDRWERHSVSGIRDSKQEFMTYLLDGELLPSNRVRRGVRCQQRCCRQHRTSSTEEKKFASWQ